MKTLIFLCTIIAVSMNAQFKVSSIERIPLPSTELWSNAVFSPSGKTVFMTNNEYGGIWQYSLETKLMKEITRDKNSGYGFVISGNGEKIAYRRTTVEGDHITRVQEVVEVDLKTSVRATKERGNSLMTPVFVKEKNSSVQRLYDRKSGTVVKDSELQIFGVDEEKIILLRNGAKEVFDPLPNGRYIWPVLSPDKSRMAFVEMDRGAFIADLNSGGTVSIGKFNAPKWSRSGDWLVGMNDADDGHVMLSSDIIVVSKDGKSKMNLTETFNGIALYPDCSPTENKILFTTNTGELYMISYVEVK